MRRFLPLLLCAGLALAACKSRNTTTITSDDGKTKVKLDLTEASRASSDMEKKMEELKKLTPLTTDQLKAMLPDELLGMKRSSFNANSMMGFASADATYKKADDSQQIRLSIFDCAGEAGAGIYSLNYWTKMSVQSENEDGYTKTVDFNGQKAVESYHKSEDSYELTYTAADRLLVTIRGDKTGLDGLRQAAQGLNLKVN
ncbi:MAG TPA: hypothetical protein VG870_12115 [Chitinophagaceae bacterium]|nr:hypothetical protein [Chitinophagaceae bacterium]